MSVEIDYDKIIASTDQATLFRIGDEDVWIPHSQILDQGDNIVEITKWFAEEKELI